MLFFIYALHKLIIKFNVCQQTHEYEINYRKLNMNLISRNLYRKITIFSCDD
jgi:hypothetical protein